MICRHAPNDTSCSSHKDYVSYDPPTPPEPKMTLKSTDSPDAYNFQVVDALEVGKHLVMKINYPNCKKCAYEGTKVMVFLHTKPLDALRWKRIDPHFRDNTTARLMTDSPGPDARFPASKQGWDDALQYAKNKCTS